MTLAEHNDVGEVGMTRRKILEILLNLPIEYRIKIGTCPFCGFPLEKAKRNQMVNWALDELKKLDNNSRKVK